MIILSIAHLPFRCKIPYFYTSMCLCVPVVLFNTSSLHSVFPCIRRKVAWYVDGLIRVTKCQFWTQLLIKFDLHMTPQNAFPATEGG